jgi:hypothetical protein
LIAVISDMLHRFTDNKYQQILRQMADWAQEEMSTEDEYEIVSSNALYVPFNKALLADEDDIDDYLKALKKALMDEINNNKRIQI